MRGRAVAVLAVLALAVLAVLAGCGETRRPIGEECLRDDDCLSAVCSARACVSAPPLVVGAPPAAPEEELRIPEADAGAGPSQVGDASDEGG
jgi:hypothetical protein